MTTVESIMVEVGELTPDETQQLLVAVMNEITEDALIATIVEKAEGDTAFGEELYSQIEANLPGDG